MNVYHRIKLFYLRNRVTITTILLSTIMTTILYLQVLMLVAILEQSKSNSDGIKGISCVLLIHPDDRTKQNVTDCIQHNTTGTMKPFTFYELKESDLVAPNRETKDIEKGMRDSNAPTYNPPNEDASKADDNTHQPTEEPQEAAEPAASDTVAKVIVRPSKVADIEPDRITTVSDTLKQLIERIKAKHANVDTSRTTGHYPRLWR